MPASTATMPDAAKAFTMKPYSNIVRVSMRVAVAVLVRMIVLRVVLVFVIVLFDLDVPRHHENAPVYAHHIDWRAVKPREHRPRNDFVDGAERRRAVAEIQH